MTQEIINVLIYDSSKEDCLALENLIHKLNQNGDLTLINYKTSNTYIELLEQSKSTDFDLVFYSLDSSDKSLSHLRKCITQIKNHSLIIIRKEDDFPSTNVLLNLEIIDFIDKDELSPYILRKLINFSLKNQKLEKELEYAKNSNNYLVKRITIGELAHEINNPLSIIYGFTSAIQSKISRGDNSKTTEYCSKIEDSVSRISKILKKNTSIERKSKRPANLKNIISDTLSLCSEELISKDINVILECPDDLEVICQDIQLSQMFLNFIYNSIHAVEGKSDKWINISISATSKNVIIKIQDSGTIAEKRIRQKIFEPYFTTKALENREGIGMNIIKDIILEHSGKIELLDHVNTTFEVTIPIDKNKSRVA